MNLRDQTLLSIYGTRDGETLPDAITRVRQADETYRRSVERLREVGARVKPVPEKVHD